MSDGTLETIGGRPALRFERALPHPIERVWRAVSDPTELEAWFPAATAWTPAAGEVIEAYGMSGVVTEVAEPHRLAWTFNGEEYGFDLSPDGEGCILVFTHVFDAGTPTAQTAAGWETYLIRLDAHLDGGHLGESEAHASWGEIHERYAALFGVDPEPGRAFWKKLSAGQ